ncbi:serine hydrolase domain-containing protein [Croceitalea marina]|uniref:Serine hydrolase domain-containing protein n=1 Tax=Croceitalea marina TaxID=1775166 RepID=A0ABW5MU60_9FLAO
MLNYKVSLNAIIIFSFLLLIGCKEQVKELTLEEKITLALESRKIPTSKDHKVSFTLPESLIGRGPQITEVFRHMENYIPTILIEKGNTKTTKLPENISHTLGQEILTSAYFEKETSLDQICDEKQVNGVIVLHKGQVVYERYPEMEPTDKHFLGSVSKTFLGTIIAHLADEGKLNEQDPIGKYIIEFKGKPLENVTIENLLRMTSGINCRESDKGSYTDPNHCFYKLLQHSAVYTEPNPGFEESLMELLANSGTIEPAGKTYDYTSANSAILTAIVERVSSKPFHQLVQEYIWTKIGAEDDARVTLSSTGVAGSYGLMLMRLRDLARYGLAFTDDATTKIASERYINQIHTGDRALFRSEGGTDQHLRKKYYEGQGADFQSYHWDVIFEDGDFFKEGFGGQGLYISPSKRLIIAFFSAGKDETNNNRNMISLVRSLALLEQFKE